MNIPKLIMDVLHDKGEVRVSDIVKLTGFSRTYINRFFRILRYDGKIILIGKANKARYILANEQAILATRKKTFSIHRILQNKDLYEDRILADVKKNTGIFLELPKNVSNILDYAFSEILNNAIEHSQSETIEIVMRKEEGSIHFDVVDKGVGIFNNIMQKRNLHTEMEAIQDLLKGKQSTAPETHSGEGIFFTSKAAEIFIIKSSHKVLIFNNLIQDIFVGTIKNKTGTKATFSISINSKKQLKHIFKKYTDDSFEFSKTEVIIRLYNMGTEYVSRSHARRIMSGLDKFKKIVLDFTGVEIVGQGFADEVFRVWKSKNPDIVIIAKDANENVEFMINRACKHEKLDNQQ